MLFDLVLDAQTGATISGEVIFVVATFPLFLASSKMAGSSRHALRSVTTPPEEWPRLLPQTWRCPSLRTSCGGCDVIGRPSVLAASS